MVDDIHQLEIGTMNCLSLVSLSDSTAYNTQRVQRHRRERCAGPRGPAGRRAAYAFRLSYAPHARARSRAPHAHSWSRRCKNMLYRAARAERRGGRESRESRKSARAMTNVYCARVCVCVTLFVGQSMFYTWDH